MRYALIEGLREEERIGINPLKLGILAATDAHNVNPGDAEEYSYVGWSGESDDTFGGVGGRHLEVGLPRSAEYSFPEMLSNPIIEQCVRRFLGPAYCRYWCGNTACPGSSIQPLHADGGGWSVKNKAEADQAGVAWPHPAYMLSVNFGVDDMIAANGSTEVSEPAFERHLGT